MLKFRERSNTWPGFVDLFSNLVIILIFLLIVFVFLWTTTNVFHSKTSNEKVIELSQLTADQEQALAELSTDNEQARQLLELADQELVNYEQSRAEMLSEISQLDQQLVQKNVTIEQLTSSYEDKLRDLNNSGQNMADMIQSLTQQLEVAQKKNTELSAEIEVVAATGGSELSVYESELQILQDELAYLNGALNAAEEKAAASEIEYVQLSERLNRALADKAAELAKIQEMGEYQSEFFREIRIALDGRTTVDTSSDRFVVPSDILFASGSYKLSKEGKNQLRLISNVIKDMENVIPTNINWIIRVDGHTDKKAVVPGTKGYRNNTELSLLRATAVVRELENNGVSKRRLAPAGFGEMYPVELGTDAASLQKNRRIELRLTNP